MRMRILILALLCLLVLPAAQCVDTATGTTVVKKPDGTTTVSQNPANPVAIAGGVVGSLPIPFAGLIGAAITAFPGIWLAIRGRQWKNAAIATAAFAGKIVGTLPDSGAKAAALKTLDVVHDAADVAESMQETLQAHAAAIAGHAS